MSYLARICGVGWVVGVILLQQLGECCAAETTERGVSGTVYGGAGNLREPNNESSANVYEIGRFGMGALGVLRFGSNERTPASNIDDTGLFAAMGATFELEESRTACTFSCNNSAVGTRVSAKHFAGRFGVGYSFSQFEFRVGALATLPDPKVSYAMPLVMPDVLMRVGRRSVGWFELGLGAYDASTNLRPGLYMGGAMGAERNIQVSSHVGVHLINGLCCGTVNYAGFRTELGLAHAFSDSVSGGVSAALAFDEPGPYTNAAKVAEGSARLSFAL